MTWLGKILAVLVLVLSLVWAWFTVTVFVTRANWKNQSEMYKTAYQKAVEDRDARYRESESKTAELSARLADLSTQNDGLKSQVATLTKTNEDNIAKAKVLTDQLGAANVNVQTMQANLQAALDEQNKARERARQLEDERVEQARAREAAEKGRLEAENLRKQAEANLIAAEQRLEDLATALAEVRASGAGPSGAVPGTRPPAAPPEGLRGTVTGVSRTGDYVQLSIGLDAGLAVGMSLDVYRRDGGNGQYLGTVVIDRVEPKAAGAVFKPSDARRTVNQLRPDEKPKVGDTVSRLTSPVNR